MQRICTYKYKGVYIYSIDDAAHRGALKIGKFSVEASLSRAGLEQNSELLRQSATDCIDNQTSRAAIEYKLEWAELALYEKDGEPIEFDDHAVHTVLENSGYKKREFNNLSSNPQEWYEVDLETALKAIQAVKDGRLSLDISDFREEVKKENVKPNIVFRKEQEDAIGLALNIFNSGGKKVLWNAKMRFGKTLCALETIRRLGYKRTLLITHRPDVRTGWFTDFDLIKFSEKHFRGANNIPRDNKYGLRKLDVLKELAKNDADVKYIYFASIQDLRGDKNIGGRINKKQDIFNTDWDLLIVDEAHEGTQTELGKKVISALQEQDGLQTLYLSGTPYNILDNFEDNEIFTWDYMMEQDAKDKWYIEHPHEPNPYEELPRLNIFTYNLGNVFDYRTKEDEDYFNFTEFFRVSDGTDGINEGDFVHEDDVRAFLDLLCKEGTDSNYPYSTEEYRFSLAHTLWVIGGVKEGAALSRLINEHKLHTEYGYQVVNVAGDGDPNDEAMNRDALKKVNDAIANNERTITLTCGRLTTGVTVREWTGVFMLAGSYNTKAATYLQTIFRCQSPSKKGVVPMKTECYAFDFAPDRTLVVIDDAIAKNSKEGNSAEKQKLQIDRFLNFCPVIAMDGSKEVVYDTTTFMTQVNRAYSDKIVSRGFKSRHLYTNLHTISDADFNKLMEIGKLLSQKSSPAKGNGKVEVSNSGVTGATSQQTTTTSTPTGNSTKPKKTNEKQKPRWERAMNVLNEISVRLPMMIFGLGISSDDISIEYFLESIDDESWSVFMPKGLTKKAFRDIKHLYNDRSLADSARLISNNIKSADELPIVHRIPAIAHIIEQFRFPDKETVLTPWRVVNMHLADAVGGWCFYDTEYNREISEPRHIDTKVSGNIFTPSSKVLEINSKSGLYPLYVAYSIFRSILEQMPSSSRISEYEELLWTDVLKNNLYVVCMSPMAVHITNRVLRGNHSEWHTNVCYVKNLTDRIKKDINSVVTTISNAHTFNKQNKTCKMKFTAIVGNPPYQLTKEDTSDAPIYHLFMNVSYRLTDLATFITPARFLFNAGKTPTEWNNKILNDKHFKVVWYKPQSVDVFPNVDIKGGVVVSLYNKEEESGSIGVFTIYEELTSITNKVTKRSDFMAIDEIIFHQNKFNLQSLYEYNDKYRGIIGSGGKEKRLTTAIFGQLDIFTSKPYLEDDICILGLVKNVRHKKYINRKYIEAHATLDKYKVLVPYSNGSGEFGETLSSPIVVSPNNGFTQSFIGFGAFDSCNDADALLKYIKTKFVRALLGVLKATQHNGKDVWKYVPLQDFTSSSDIDWSKSIAEIDKQLYAKYGLDEKEIDFIESKVKPME